MLVAYEASIRNGAAIMDYYDYAHSSGTFGAVGGVASVVYGDFGINQVRDENVSIRTLVDRVNNLVK